MHFPPCGTHYHAKCIQAGKPFRTRLKQDAGLSYPHSISPPSFVCELCSVQANLGRLLTSSPSDTTLLLLERVRMIDCANSWARNTLTVYGTAIRWLQQFELHYTAPILSTPQITCPPVTNAIPLAWAELLYSLRTTRSRSGEILPVKYGTVTRLRSAASWYHSYAMTQAFPNKVIRDKSRNVCVNHVSPTDAALTTSFHHGLSRRLGTDAIPCWALQAVHIHFIEAHLDKAFLAATDPVIQHELACAGSAHLMSFLGWLRSQETFSVSRSDVTITSPSQGPTRGLPPNVGAIELRLKENTKSDQSLTADIIIAYTTLSGLSLGKWLTRLLKIPPVSPDCLFSTKSKPRWTSSYFRFKFIYPLLELQRLQGEPTLQCFTNIQGQRIQDKINSIHAWRRGGRTTVGRAPYKMAPGARKATKMEIYNHGRWAHPRKHEEIAHQYNQWDLFDRIGITLFCM